MKPPALGVMIVIVAVLFAAALHYIASAHGAEPPRPYFCLLYDEAKRKCAFGQCDQREIWQLRKECLLDDEAERFAGPPPTVGGPPPEMRSYGQADPRSR